MNNRRVYKWELEITDRQQLSLPRDCKILHVAQQGRELMVWGIVDIELSDDTIPVDFYIVGTGNPVPDQAEEFIGTALWDGGVLIWHVFRTNRA